MAEAVSSCVHCGFCLPDCPTYRALGEEMDSPRGRIFLMKDALEGKAPPALQVAQWKNTGKKNKALKLSELKGKVVVLDFWGVW